jgi:hypothetical protein
MSDAVSSDLLRDALGMAELAGRAADPARYPPGALPLPLGLGFAVKTTAGVEVALTGSRDVRDWAVNLDCDLVPLHGHGHAHGGFVQLADQVYDGLVAHLRRLGPDGPGVRLTGHSRGGALALLLAVSLAADRLVPLAVYSFGAPRAGDADFAASLPAPHHRFVNTGDPVPHLPPAGDFSHGDGGIVLTGQGRAVPVSGLAALLLSAADALTRLSPTVLTDSHRCAEYERRLRACLAPDAAPFSP